MVSKKIKYLLFGFFIVAASLGIYGYREYNRKPSDLANTKVLENITANALINAYSIEEDAANKKYLGKVIGVSGTVVEVTNLKDTAYTILLGDTSNMSRVSCTVDKNHITAAKKYTVGSNVKVKGICTGFLMDVELNRCLIVE